MATSTIPSNASAFTTKEEIEALDNSAIVAEVKRASRYIVDADKRSANATDWAAYVTYMADRHGMVGGGKEYSSQEDFVQHLGKSSKSLYGGWLTLGIALVDVGLDPKGQTYLRLRNSNQYGVAAVKDVVRKEGATEEDIVKVLEGRVDENGRRIVKRAAQPGGTSNANKVPDATDGNKLREYVAEKAREFMDSAVNLSDADFAHFERTLSGWFKDQIEERRAKAAAKVA